MDYLFLEANDEGAPISNNLMFETWEMPLPKPQAEASSEDNTITINILMDAWFVNGKTTFEIEHEDINFTKMDIKDRVAILETDNGNLKGKTIKFLTKDNFYYHEGYALIQ